MSAAGRARRRGHGLLGRAAHLRADEGARRDVLHTAAPSLSNRRPGPGPGSVDLVLSSGWLGFALHSGVIQAIEDAGLRVSAVMGTSSGALAGSLYAAGYSPTAVARELSRVPPIRLLRRNARTWEGFFVLDGVVNRLRCGAVRAHAAAARSCSARNLAPRAACLAGICSPPRSRSWTVILSSEPSTRGAATSSSTPVRCRKPWRPRRASRSSSEVRGERRGAQDESDIHDKFIAMSTRTLYIAKSPQSGHFYHVPLRRLPAAVEIPGSPDSPFVDGGLVDRVCVEPFRQRRRAQLGGAAPPAIVHVISR